MKNILTGILACLGIVLTVAVSAFAGVILAILGIVLKFALMGGAFLVFLYMLVTEWGASKLTSK